VYSRNTGEDTLWKQYLPFIFAGIAFLAGIPIYLKHRTSMSEPPAVPAWRP
jgi:basic amino acid/polyamine antiporter, APA family